MNPARICPTCQNPIPADAPGGACPRCLMAIAFATDAGAMTPDVAPDEVVQRFPGYEVMDTIGRGGMGVVFRARQKALDRDVALKVLPGGPSRPAGFTERFEREAKALARLQHSGIVQVFDFGTSADGWCYLAMELVDGVNLRRALADGRLAPKQALTIVPQLCDALQYAHDRGVVHRDIKPENLLLTKDGRVKIADFGLAKLASDARGAMLTHTGYAMGTPLYMAPEQVEHPGDVDHRADIYSLGVVFYEMLTGELPIGRFAAPSKKSDVDSRIDDIVLRTLEKERDARFQRVAEVKTKIDEAGGPPPLPPQSRVPVMDAVAEKTTAFHQTWFARKGPNSRVSKLALLVLVACIVPCVMAVENAHSAGATFVFTAPAILLLLFLSLVAWGRIRRSGGRLYGLGFAAIGVLTALVLVPFSIVLVGQSPSRTRAQPNVAFDEAARTRQIEQWNADRAAIRRLVERALAIRPVTDVEALRAFYLPQDHEVLSAMSADARAKRGDAGQLGLPLVADDFFDEDIALFHVEDANVLNDDADVSLRSQTSFVAVKLVRLPTRETAENGWPTSPESRAQWRFALAPVRKGNLVKPGSPVWPDGRNVGPATPKKAK